jgi:phenylpyruvate tautomerase PptA (4-oxalocrotonate tautomerase family)
MASAAERPLSGVLRNSEKKETTVPHVVVKLWRAKSERQKTRLAEEVAKGVINILNYGEESVSLAFEEVNSQD